MNTTYNIPFPQRKSYPLVQERLLVEKVKNGDRSGAREILNNLLGTIMFHDPGNFNVLKARLLELLTILSRAAIEAGANAEILLSRNQAYIATMPSGHTGVFRREGSSRLPIRELFATPALETFQDLPQLSAAVLDAEIAAGLARELDTQLAVVLQRAAA